MYYRMLKKDLGRNKTVTVALFLFICLACALMAASASIITELMSSMDGLFAKSVAPHFVQMHAGEIDQMEIDRFSESNPLVQEQHTAEMLNINGASVYLRKEQQEAWENEAKSVIEISFVKQNPSFDLLLDLQSQSLSLEPGEVAVPVHYLKQSGLTAGDTLLISQDGFQMELLIVDFVRDVQMNSSLVTSKRFVVSDEDWTTIKDAGIFESEYLIEFLLHDGADTGEFERMYVESGLPNQDTAITLGLYKLLNAVTDGLVAAVIVLVSLLLVAISVLCLRYTLIAAVEEDYREIGAMKALGLPNRFICGLYTVKYMALTAAAGGLGCLASKPLAAVFTANILLYMGEGEKTALYQAAPAAGSLLVVALVMASVRTVLGRFRRISAVEAVRGAAGSGSRKGARGRSGSRKRMRLHKSRNPWVNVFLGVREAVIKPSSHGVLCVVFALCVLLASLPVNLLSTTNSPSFISYMGAAMSDIRIDLMRSEHMEQRFEEMMAVLEADPEVERAAGFVTRAYQSADAEGNPVVLKVETGDFSVYPLEYAEGRAPVNQMEIALSAMNAQELGKSLGDGLTLTVDGQSLEHTVCGIYQDVTNGGKTAKAKIDSQEDVLWYVVNLDLAPGTDLEVKKEEYAEAFAPIKVVSMEEYLSQTLGSVIDQLRLAAWCGFGASALFCALVTALFFKMSLAKDAGQVAVFRSLGFSHRHLRTQYVSRMMTVLLLGVGVGIVLSAILGTAVAGGIFSLLGASRIQLVINPAVNYALIPGALAATVILVVSLGSKELKKTDSLRLGLE